MRVGQSTHRFAGAAAIALTTVVALAGCGGQSIDQKISQFEGYKVTNCQPDRAMDKLAQEVRDTGAKGYDCSGGLGVVIESDGQMSDYDASSDEQGSSSLTAAQIAGWIIAKVTAKNGDRLKRVNCGSNTDVQSGSVLNCKITMPGGQARDFTASVSKVGSKLRVTLGTSPGKQEETQPPASSGSSVAATGSAMTYTGAKLDRARLRSQPGYLLAASMYIDDNRNFTAEKVSYRVSKVECFTVSVALRNYRCTTYYTDDTNEIDVEHIGRSGAWKRVQLIKAATG